MAEEPTPPTHHHRRWLDVRSTFAVLAMPEIGLLVLTFFLATFAFSNFEGTLSLLNEALGLGRTANYAIFAGVGFTLILCQGFLYRRLAKRWPDRRFVILGVALMAAGLAVIGLVSVFGAAPVPPGGFSILAATLVGVLFSIFSAMQFVFAPLWGRVSDRIGRRPVLLLGLLGSVVFYALFGFGAEMGQWSHPMLALLILFVSRAGQGVAGATIATAQAAIADSTTPQERSRGMALIGAAFGIGFTFGPILGVVMVSLFPHSLGSPGFAAAVLSLAALAVGWRQLPETLPSLVGGVDAAKAKAALRIVFLVVVIDLLGFGLVLPLLPRLGEAFIKPVLAGEIPLFDGSAPEAVAPTAVSSIGVGLGAAYAAGLILAVMGFSFLTPSLQALISKRTDATRQGEVLGVNQSAAALARILGPLIGIPLLKVSALPFWPYAMASGLLLLLIWPATRIRKE